MIVYVLDSNYDRICVIDSITSLIWTERYYTYGDCELYVPVTEAHLDALQYGNYLMRDEDDGSFMVIKKIEVKTDQEDGDYITVTGQCLKSVVYQRIIWNVTNLAGNLEQCIGRLLRENLISPNNRLRMVSGFEYRNELSTGIDVSVQYTGKNLGECISDLCQQYGLGWNVRFDPDTKMMYLYLYQGVDRTSGQESVPPVVFSNQNENLIRSSYLFDASNYRNVAKVAGEGEGINRRTIEIGTSSGLQRHEEYVDARDITSNDGQIGNSDYERMLRERGEEKLAELRSVERFDGEVDTHHTYQFGTDYGMGDIVEVVNAYGVSASTRIIEMIQCVDESGIYAIPTFSDYIIEED